MTKIIALNSNRLSNYHYHYHWLWGLTNVSKNKSSLYDEAKILKEDPEKLRKIINQISSVERRSQLVGFCYWVFNINSYRKNFYRLHSYLCSELYEKGVLMLSDKDQQKAQQLGSISILSGVEHVLSKFSHPCFIHFPDSLISDMAWFSAQIDNLERLNAVETRFSEVTESNENTALILNNEVESYTESASFTLNFKEMNNEETRSTDTGHYFIVTDAMLSSLTVLGISALIGEQIDFTTLKSVYRKKLLATHPDKTSYDSNSAFLAVRAAMQTLLSEISTTSASATYPNDFNDFVYNFSLRELFSIFIARSEAMNETLSNELKKWQSVSKSYINTMEVTLARMDKVIAKQQDLIKQSEQYSTNVKVYIEQVDEVIELSNLLSAKKNGLLSDERASNLLTIAEQYGGLTKLPYYDPKKPCPARFFENLPETSLGEDEADSLKRSANLI